jgi:hypothetical protein
LNHDDVIYLKEETAMKKKHILHHGRGAALHRHVDVVVSVALRAADGICKGDYEGKPGKKTGEEAGEGRNFHKSKKRT